MASQEVDACTNYPDFAVICSFIENFGDKLNTNFPNIGELQKLLEDTENGNVSELFPGGLVIERWGFIPCDILVSTFIDNRRAIVTAINSYLFNGSFYESAVIDFIG